MGEIITRSILVGITLLITSCNFQNSATAPNSPDEIRVSRFVDPFIGTGGHGHTFPGASRPFGMIQLSPDNGRSGWDWSSGYHYSDSIISGFSHLHLSGTGIGDLSDILFMPINKEVDLKVKVDSIENIPYSSKFKHSTEEASPGFYTVYLEDHDIKVSLTTTERTGYHKYEFKKDELQSLVIDLGFAINWDRSTDSQINIEDATTISGYRFSTGWAENQKVFFVAELSKPITKKRLVTDGKEVKEKTAKGRRTAAQLFFDAEGDEELKVKVALSSVSINNARENLDKVEFNFEEIKEESAQVWENSLRDIEIKTEVDSLKTIFYSSLYHTKLAPVTFNDKNGELRMENDSIAKVDFTVYSTLSLWDTFRAQQPLLTLTDPRVVSDIIKSMLEYYETEGALPVWTLYGNETNTMSGNHSIPVIVEAYFKGIRDFDVEKAYKAMKETMMHDQRGLKFYKQYGYIPYGLMEESVTYTLEYAYNDWCIAQMAQDLGEEEDYQYFSERAKAYQHHFDPETGFMRGRAVNGSWHEPFNPKFSSHMENTDYTEGNAWQHSWFVLHEPEELIALHGGAEKFTDKLELLFTESSEIVGENASADISGLIGQYAHGNEPSHHIAFLFNKAGKPWRTQYWVREILKTQYNTTPNGLSGNEDAGQMSAWYVFSSMGLYPFNPASAEYEISSPIFEESKINLANGKSFIIRAENLSEENIYIQSALLNGKDFNRTSISHQEILEGGELEFQMGPVPNKNWGVDK